MRGLPEDGQHHATPGDDQSPCDKKVISFSHPSLKDVPCMMITSRHVKWIKLAAIYNETFNHDASQTSQPTNRIHSYLT